MKRTFEEINAKIKAGTAVVVTAEEVVAMVKKEGVSAVAAKVDVVTTATFGPMCSSGAVLNFGHSDPPIRMEQIELNDVDAYGGLAAVDTYIGVTAESRTKGIEYGGAHVICDLIAGKEVKLKARGKGTDCYPRKEIDTVITLEDVNEAYLFNPRNCYQNYAAGANTSSRILHTYMGVLQPNLGNINYSTAGELSPLLKDPGLRAIGMGTRIFIGGAVGYVGWNGTQFNTNTERDENGVPKTPGATLALMGNLRDMNPEYIAPAVFDGYGISLNLGVGIPIPVLDEDLLADLARSNEELYTNIVDYSVQSRKRPILSRVSYAALRSGTIELNGRTVKTAPITSLHKSRKIAEELKAWIAEGKFLLQEPIQTFPQGNAVKTLEIKGGSL